MSWGKLGEGVYRIMLSPHDRAPGSALRTGSQGSVAVCRCHAWGLGLVLPQEESLRAVAAVAWSCWYDGCRQRAAVGEQGRKCVHVQGCEDDEA